MAGTMTQDGVNLQQSVVTGDARPRKVPLMERIRRDAPPGVAINPPGRFRLLQGTHTDEDVRTGEERTWVFNDPTNNVIETYKKLDLVLNVPGYPPKVEALDGGPTARTSPYEPLVGETKEQYAKRLDDLVRKQLEAFDAGGMASLSAEVAGQPQGQQPQAATAQTPGKPVDQMTEQELRQLAKDEGVDLKGFRGNADQLRQHLRNRLGV